MTDLDAWLYGTRVAVIRRTNAGRLSLEFADDARHRWGVGASVISVQLPLLTKSPPAAVIEAWLRGLMPEGRARARLAERASVDPNDVLGFLAHYGRDTAGALVLVPEGDDPGQPDRPLIDLSDQEIADQLALADANGAADQASSLPGLETKVVLTRTATGWSMPTPKAPSTHIVKLSRPETSRTADLIDTEAAALELARHAGIGDVQAHLHTFVDQRAIVVTRYDRRPDLEAATVQRLHQEDAAQMLGLNTDDPLRKFQYGASIPSLAAIAAKLSGIGVALEPLLALTTLNLAIGNVDAHAKNISVLHGSDGRHQLAPAYDIAMHLHQDTGESRFAMDVAGERDMKVLGAGHLIEEAVSWRMPRRRAISVIGETLERLEAASAAIDRGLHAGVSGAAWAIVDARIASLNRQVQKDFPTAQRRQRAQAKEPQARMPQGHPFGGRFTKGE